MIIVYFLDSKRIINFRMGNPTITELDGKYYSNGEILTTVVENIGIKHIADQSLACDIDGMYLHDADYYDAVTPTDRLADIETALLDLAEAIL